MKKFFVFTTGRTGSTAICDELNSRDDMVCWQEIFNTISKHRLEQGNVSLPDEEKHFNDFGVPCQVYQGINPGSTVADFLTYTENRSASMGSAMGFKLLYHEPNSWGGEGLLRQLKGRGYRCLHLVRQDHAGRTFSSLIANARGHYNTKNTLDWSGEKILIDPMQFTVRLKNGIVQIENARKTLRDVELPTLEIYYEDFVADPNGFHGMISGDLNLATQARTASEYKKVTPSDLGELIENYDAIQSCATQVLEKIAADR